MFTFKRRPGFRGRRNGTRYLVAAAVAGVLIGIPLWQDLARMRHQEARIRIDSARLDLLYGKVSKERRAARQEQQRQRQRQPAKGGSRMLTALDVLAGLEADWQENISFLRIDGDIGKRRLRMQVLAKSREELFQFVARLKSRFGEDVFLERHALVPTPRDGWRVSASMAVGWQ